MASTLSVRARIGVASVAILFTDIEGSTRLARALGERWPEVVGMHHATVGDAIAAHGGLVEKTTGDGFMALFGSVGDAARSAAEAQRRLADGAWPDGVEPVRVRMGIHYGEVRRDEHELTGLDIHLAARVEAAANGGQVVMTETVRAALGKDFEVVGLGEHRLKDFPAPEPLHQLVYDGRGPEQFPALRTEPVRPTNLPVRTRSLLGREEELDRLADLILRSGERLVTVTGRGGSGKTRLALAAGERLLSDFPGGVWLVMLAEVQEADEIVAAVADALGVPEEVGRPLLDVVVERLRARPTVLVVDNVEQLVERGAPEIIRSLLERTADCHVLATSQRPLRLADEVVVGLGALDSAPARELFAERALAALPTFDAAAHAEAIAEVCERVDCLPLAVELAAARVTLLTPAELLSRLDDSLGVLAGASRDRSQPERQSSMRATLDWTFGLLSPGEAALARRLATFAGAVPLDAVERMAAIAPPVDALVALEGLLEASLVQRWESRAHGVRFGMPQAVRTYAAERLAGSGEDHEARRVHAEHLAGVAAAVRFWRAAPPEAHAHLSALGEELRPALTWARAHAPQLHVRLIGSVGSWLVHTGRLNEGFEEVATALDAVGHEAGGPDVGYAKVYLAYHLEVRGRDERLRELIEAGLAELRAAGDTSVLGDGLRLAAIVYQFASITGHEAFLEESLAIARRLGDPYRLAVDLVFRSQSSVLAGDLEACTRYLDEAESLVDPRYYNDVGITTNRADLAWAKREWPAAAAGYARSAAWALRQHDLGQVFLDLSGQAAALAGLGRHGEIVELDALRELLHAETGEPDERIFWVDYDAVVAEARSALSSGEMAEAVARVRDLPRHARPDRILELGAARG